MLFIINMLDIQHNKVCIFDQFIKFGEERLFSCKWLSAGIQRCVDTSLMRFSEQLDQKVNLQKRFSATYCNTAFCAPIAAEPFRFIQKFISSLQVIRFRIPCVYIMAILAAHIAAFQKDQVSDARSVDCSK